MTEIPEHLLKRSRKAKGGSSADGDASPAGEAVTPAASSAAAAPAGVPPALAKAAASMSPDKPAAPAKPVPAYIAAANARKKMPIWAMGLVFALPIWAWIYAGTMQEQAVEDTFLIDAAEIYTVEGGCAGCHGAGGGGGSGYQFSAGEIMKTFPSPVDQMVHIARGSAAITGEQYGDPNRDGGARIAGQRGVMPGFGGTLSLEHLELVVYHERHILGGEELTTEAFIAWEEELREKIESGSSTPITDEVFQMLLSCANPEFTPGATGAPENPEECPGPKAAEGEEAALGG
ncbi:MAG: hypothetical protein R2710_09735 [Acidimicrobiales bacterium]